MRNTIALLGVLALGAPAATRAQTHAQQVIAAAQELFRGMQQKDAVALRAILLPDARLHGVSSQGGATSPSMSVDQFVETITTGVDEFLERMWNPRVQIDGPVASLWTEYDFHRGGQFSHCGVDAFHMVRRNDGWKIATITWTTRLDGCYSPLGPPQP